MLNHIVVIITVAGTFISLFAGLLIFSQYKKEFLGYLFLVFSMGVALLNIANYFSIYSSDSSIQTWSARVVMMMATVLVSLLYIILRHIDRQYRFLLGHEVLVLLVAILLVVMNFYGVFLISVTSEDGIIQSVAGPGIVLFLVNFVIILTLSIIRLARGANSILPEQRSKYKILTIGLMPAAILAPITGVIMPMMYGRAELVFLSPIYIVVFLCYMGYATIKYGLFDIRLAAVRTAGYTFTIGAVAIIYVILAYAISQLFFEGDSSQQVSFSPINIALALVLTMIFQPIKQFFDQFTNRVFYRGQYDQEVFFREFGKILSYDTDLRLLLKQASKYIVDNLRAEKAFFNIADRGAFGVVKLKSDSSTKIHQQDIENIDEYYKKHYEFPAVMSYEMVDSQNIRDIFKLYKISLVLPLKLQDQTMGHLFIGEHKSRGYSMRDVRVIESVANELAIAVQNSLSVEEIRELNESLQTRVSTATKELRTSNQQLQKLDEAKNDFMSIASHQLRTPLTSIKGYLDMMLQGDLGKITPTQRSVLSEAYVSSERMVSLINDFLSASRLQTGKFVVERCDGDLRDVVKDQVNILKVVAKQHDMTLELAIDKKVPNVQLDIDKIRQVIQNFIDNAIYYSMPASKIKISLDLEGKYVAFRVKDTGIGVPIDEQPQLFSRFFRAGNARRRRPDGTGIGLYLAKKVVRLHDGEIIFHSEENKGSTFGFMLPVK